LINICAAIFYLPAREFEKRQSQFLALQKKEGLDGDSQSSQRPKFLVSLSRSLTNITEHNPQKYMSKIVPLIGSAEVGPLGVLHLPRLWLKVSLSAKGLLADGYPAVGTGFDQMVIDGLGLQKEAVVDYIAKHKPTYCEFESWIKQQPGTRIDAGTVDKLNASIRGYNHDEGTVQSVLGENGLPSDSGIRDAVTLNRIDDWKCFHEAVLK
jgi:hypothetical protein